MSVDHRLPAPDTPLSDAVADGWEALEQVFRTTVSWDIDPERIAVFGESTGGLIAALAAIRARDSGLPLEPTTPWRAPRRSRMAARHPTMI